MTTCALVGAVDFNEAHFRAQAFDCVIAVDGGYAHLDKAGIVPDLVLGDFDSLGYVPDHRHVEVHPTHKDASDIELAMGHAASEGYDELVVYGCLSGRLDHTYGVLQLIAKFTQEGLRVFGIGDTFATTALVGNAIGGSCALGAANTGTTGTVADLIGPTSETADAGASGDLHARIVDVNASSDLGFRTVDTLRFFEQAAGTLSAFAITDSVRGVDEIGLAYPLSKATLTNNAPIGISNEFIGERATVSVEEGTLLVFFPLDTWGALILG